MLIIRLIFTPLMNLNTAIVKRLLKRKIATLLLVSASVGAFATLGDDSGKKSKKEAAGVALYSAKNFSLRSNYNYRSNNLFSTAPQKKEFIMLNPTVTYQTGNTAYVLPLKKAPLLGKITFTSTPKR